MTAVNSTRVGPSRVPAAGINIHSTKLLKVARPDGFDEVEFRFSDRRWPLRDILRPHEVNGAATINFDMAEWLVEDCKLYVADRWLNTKADANRLQGFMVAMRMLGRLLPDFGGRPIDLRMRHARQVGRLLRDFDYSASYYQMIQTAINDFLVFVRRLYPDVVANDFRLVLSQDLIKIPQDVWAQNARRKLIPTEVASQIIDACLSDIRTYYRAKEVYVPPTPDREAHVQEDNRSPDTGQQVDMAEGRRLCVRDLLGRAVKATATVLALCVGRRIAAVCNAALNTRTEKLGWVNEWGQTEQGVLVRFTEFKVSNAEEDVFCPGAYGELAIYAIETAKDLTSQLRDDNPRWENFLFLVPGKKLSSVKVLSPFQINHYINGYPGSNNGIMQRYNILYDGRVTPQDFRRARATRQWMGGMQVHEVASDLGHVDSQSAMRHYILGNEEHKRRFIELVNHGALAGVLEDFIGGSELVDARIGRHHVEIMHSQGLVVTPTRYGYCALHGSSGPCSRALPCYLGVQVDDEGCEWHILSPDAIPALNEDKEVLEAGIKKHEHDPSRRQFVRNQRNQLGVVERRIERALALQARVGGCDGKGACACRPAAETVK